MNRCCDADTHGSLVNDCTLHLSPTVPLFARFLVSTSQCGVIVHVCVKMTVIMFLWFTDPDDKLQDAGKNMGCGQRLTVTRRASPMRSVSCKVIQHWKPCLHNKVGLCLTPVRVPPAASRAFLHWPSSRLKPPRSGVKPILFTREFGVEAGQRDAERLRGAQRVVVVHREHVLSDAPELHHDVVNCNKTILVTTCACAVRQNTVHPLVCPKFTFSTISDSPSLRQNAVFGNLKSEATHRRYHGRSENS